MPLTPEQRQQILAGIASGHLRLDAPRKMYAGYGDGRECVGCKGAINAKEEEYEAIYANGEALRFHLACASLWDAERRRQRVSENATEEARRVRADAEATRQKARETAKESAQARDRADVLARESEAAIEESRRVKRGEQPIGEGVVDHVGALAQAVLSHRPDVHCFLCLAPQIGITEKTVRDAAQVLLVRGGFLIESRVCATCGNVEDLLVVKEQ